MGGGRKFTADVAKGPPSDAVEAVFGRAAPDTRVAERLPYCEQMHVVGFEASAGAVVEVGSAIQLVLGSPRPAVRQQGRTVGVVDAQSAEAMQGCLEANYRMAGTVRSFDAEVRVGVLEIVGSADG